VLSHAGQGLCVRHIRGCKVCTVSHVRRNANKRRNQIEKPMENLHFSLNLSALQLRPPPWDTQTPLHQARHSSTLTYLPNSLTPNRIPTWLLPRHFFSHFVSFFFFASSAFYFFLFSWDLTAFHPNVTQVGTRAVQVTFCRF
jgi:hypothetical protein